MTKRDRIQLSRKDLLAFFTEYLHKIHATKSHLIARLSILHEEAYFEDLQEGLEETIKDVRKQIERVQVIYEILDMQLPASGTFKGLHQLADESFEDIKRYTGSPELRDMTMLFYLLNIESIEMASFQILQMLAVKLKNDEIKRLVKASYEDAKAGKTLFQLITAKYIASA